jgi:L-alanine-DL-glutamate epimerase-like enolase superfamily enzyme
MRITGFETLVLNMPMVLSGDRLPMMAGSAKTSMDTLLLRVDTDEGISGWGEGFGHRIFPATKAVLDRLVGPMIVGRDASAIRAIQSDIARVLAGSGRAGPALYALSAVDIALWDIAGKAAGLPLYRLLGGSARTQIPAYASLLRYGEGRAVVGRLEELSARGYRQFKIHEIQEDVIRAARTALGSSTTLMVDCARAWGVAEATAMARRLGDVDLAWLEEPIFPPDDERGLARVRHEGGVPTAAGENATTADFRRMFEADALDVAQPSVAKIGGITGMRSVIATAESFGVRVVPHSAYFGPGFLAALHCAAALTNDAPVERYDADFEVNPHHDAINPDQEGNLAVPQDPGLGVDPDPTVVDRLRVE